MKIIIPKRGLALLLLVNWEAAGAQEVPEHAQEQKARVIGEISDGAPSPPQPPKSLPDFQILDSKVVVENGRTVTLRRVKKPTFPAPAILATPEPSVEEVQAYIESSQYQQQKEPSEFCIVTATVFDHSRTLVRWWPEGSKEPCEAWSNIDFNLFGGFHAFRGREQKYLFIMGITNRNAGEFEEFKRVRGNVPDLSSLQQVAPVYMVTKGDTADAKAMKIMDAFHDLFEAEKPRLETAYALRERHRLEREADLLANPPQPEDRVIYYWPKKGSRYLNSGEEGADG